MESKIKEKKINDSETFRIFPKIELHRHLEGTFSAETLFKISLRNDLPMPKNFEEFKKECQFPKDSKPDFLAFLSKFKNDWYRTHQDVWDITYNSVLELKKDGIFYIELRFSPEHFALQNNFDREEITKLIVEAGNEAAQKANIHIRYLITFNRSKQNEDEMLHLYKKILALNIPEIVGIDLAGDELNFPAKNFRQLFEKINSDGVYGSTIHAGEVSPPEDIWNAIKETGAHRIGHGTSAIYDNDLQKYLIEKEIVLEQCITSNYQTGSWDDEKKHPIDRLYRKGVPVTINSDDPFIQDTDLTEDYIKASSYFNFSFQDFVKLNMNAIKGSFLTSKEKEQIRTEYMEALNTLF
jgi:adenosine deaminase